MRRLLKPASVLILTPLLLTAQSTIGKPFVRASADASISVRPDLAKVAISIVTQGSTADLAAGDNATRTTAVFDKLHGLLGAAADIRTVNYSLNPNYTYPRDGGTPTLSGFTAINSIEATVTDLTLIGRVIDTAIGAGATRIDGVRLMLKDEEPPRNQALRLAGQKAKARAESIAAGLGAKLGALLAAEQGTDVRPMPLFNAAAQTVAATPIQPGTLEIRADVTVQYELVQ